MDSIESEGRTVDDAVERGLARLGLNREQVRVEVVHEGGGGFLRLFGSGRARVRLIPAGGEEERIRAMVDSLLRAMDLVCQVTVASEADLHRISIETAGADGLLIGRKGDTLTALQHIIDRMVNHGRAERLKLSVDVGGYRERRVEALKSRALAIAGQVKASGREKSTDPLPPPDRRVVHLTLAEDPQIRTYTLGEGTYRSVVVAPAGRTGGASARHRGSSRGARRPERELAQVGADDGEEED